MKLDEALRRGLAEAARGARFDRARWRDSLSGRSGGRRGRRGARPVRRWVAVAAAAAVVAAGITVPLAMLSGLGPWGRGPEPLSGMVTGHGIRLELPPGWEGLVSGPQPPDFGPILQAANAPLASGEDDPFATITREDLGSGQVAVVLIEYTEVRASMGLQPGENGTFEVEEPPIAIRAGDFQPSFEGVSQLHDFARRTFTINGRSFDLWVEFGEKPAPQDLLAEVNNVLTTLEVEPLPSPPGYRTHTDLNDGLAITIPDSWRFSEEPTDLIEPQNALAFGSWGFPDGGVCAPFAALDELPADGAFVWLIVYHGTDHPEDFVPRPDGFNLDDFRFGETSCEGTPMYQLRFRDEGRFFQWQVAFGSEASESIRSETVRALDTLEAITCDAAGDAYVPTVEPSSGSPGAQATVTGEVPHGEGNEGGFPADPTVWVEVWWNLDPGDDAWASALPGGEEPIAARPGPVLRLGRVGVAGSCTYEVAVTVPDVAAGTYPIVVIQGGPEGASAFRPVHFDVPVGREVFFPTWNVDEVNALPQALLTGTLVRHDGCLFAEYGPDEALLLWPNSLHFEDKAEGRIVDNSGEVVVAVGDELRMGGGYLTADQGEEFHTAGPIPPPCRAPGESVWFVGEILQPRHWRPE